ncbi:hypothetical protein ASF44_18015 [Pseudorhodoferax sp. Leaf274]|nr:hypothetical protein ASF44_18015 [Pseudorhodoferax sp. Leaf274]
MVVSGASAASRRVAIWKAAKVSAVATPSSTPTVSSPAPGRTTSSMPAKPSTTPSQRCSRCGSCNSQGASAIRNTGAMKFMAVASASGTRWRTEKKSSVDATMSAPRSSWPRSECVRNRPRPWRGNRMALERAVCTA